MNGTISNHAAAAKMIRAELKKRGIKASVTSQSYSGGNSVTAKILADVPPTLARELREFVDQFQYGHFDGMIDCYEYSNRRDDIPQVKFASCEVRYSDAIRAEAEKFIADYFVGLDDYQRREMVYRILCGSTDAADRFWSGRASETAAN